MESSLNEHISLMETERSKNKLIRFMLLIAVFVGATVLILYVNIRNHQTAPKNLVSEQRYFNHLKVSLITIFNCVCHNKIEMKHFIFKRSQMYPVLQPLTFIQSDFK